MSVLEDLLSDDDDDRDSALAGLAEASAAERARLLPLLAKELTKRLKGAKDDDNEFGAPASALLALRLPEADQAVAAAADHKNPDVRSALPSIFEEYPSEAGRAVILKLVADKDEDVRDAAFDTLKDQPMPEALEPLLQQAAKPQSDEANLLQALAACARGAKADARAKVETRLEKGLAAKDPDTVDAAIGGTLRLGEASPSLLEKLRTLAAAKTPRLRASALGALAELGDERDARLAQLIELGAKGNKDESASAHVTLHEVSPALVAPALLKATSHALPIVRADAVLLSTSIPALAALADVGRIEALLGDDDAGVRANAAFAAARLSKHKERLVPKLEAMAKDKAKEVKAAAKNALARLENDDEDDDEGEDEE